MEQSENNTTAILLEFDLLTEDEKKEIISYFSENIGKFIGGRSQDFDSTWGGVTIYQP